MEKGTLQEEGAPAETANPSFVELSADQKLLYAVNELTTFQGRRRRAQYLPPAEKECSH